MTWVSNATFAASIVSVVAYLGLGAIAANADDAASPAPNGKGCEASVVRAGGPDEQSHAVAFAAPQLDTRYLISSGGYYQIAAVDGMTVTTVNAANRTATWLAGFIYAANPMDKASVEAIWPLEIGKTVTFRESAGKDAWCHTVSVLRAESVTVTAGTFDTLVVAERIQGLTPAQEQLDVTRTYWYAPTAHWVVKRELKQASGPPYSFVNYNLTQMVAVSSRPPTIDRHWAKIACSDAHIDLPFTQPHDCYRGPIGKGDTGDCHAERYGTAGADNAIQFEIYLTLAGGRCGVYFSEADVQSYTQQATAMSRNGLNFSGLKRFGGAEVVSFTGRGRQGPLSCFAFARLGPVLRHDAGLYRYAMRGHVCKADGTTLTDADIEPLARAIGVD